MIRFVLPGLKVVSKFMVTSNAAAVASVLAVAVPGCAAARARAPTPHHLPVTIAARTPARAAEVSLAPAPQRPVASAFDADGRRVASIGEDGELTVWALDGSSTLVRLPHAIPLVSGETLVVWDGSDGVVIATEAAVLRAELAPPRITTLLSTTANVSPDGRRAARALDAKAGIVEVIDTRDGHTDARLKTRLSGVSVAGWIDRHDALALRDASGHLEILDIDKGTRRARCPACGARGERDGILDGALGASPDGRFFTTRRWDLDPKGRRVDVLDASTGAVRTRLSTGGFYIDPVQPRSTTSSLTWSPDGRHVAIDGIHIELSPSAGAYASTELYDTASWSLLAKLGGDVNLGNVFLKLAFSANGSRLFTWSTSEWDGEVADVASRKPLTLTPHTGGRPSPDGRLVLGEDGLMREVETARVIAGIGAAGYANDLAFSDGTEVLAVLRDNRLELRSLGSGLRPAPTAGKASTSGLRWTRRGELVATASIDSYNWRRFDAVSGALLAWGHPAWGLSAEEVLSPDGTALAWIRPCNGVDTTATRGTPGGPLSDSCVELIISESDRSRPRVIERTSRMENVELAWSADGATLGLADAGLGLQTYDAATGARLSALGWPTIASGHPVRVAVANGGMRLGVVVDDTSSLVVADFATGATRVVKGRYRYTLGWTTDGRYLLAQVADALVVIDATTTSVARSIPIPHVDNEESLVARDIPRLVGSGNADAWLRVERALASCGRPTHASGPCALSSDGRFVAWASGGGPDDDSIELVRMADGARLKLQQQWLGQPVFLVSDQSGQFDCNDAALAHVVVRSLEPGARPEPAATSSLARRVPGLLASFFARQQVR